MTLHAWVESPLQFLNAVEYAHACDAETVIHLRRDISTLTRMATLLKPHLPAAVSVVPGGRSAVLSRFALSSERVLGDAYSGQVRAVLAGAGGRRCVIVDDGSVMLALGKQLADGRPLQRPGNDEGWSMRRLGALATRRIRRGIARGTVEIFTAYGSRAPFRELARLGARVTKNSYGWVREIQLEATRGLRPTVVVGAALVPDGHLRAEPYLAWLRERAAAGEVTYIPHRRERGPWLDSIASIPGLAVLHPGLPIEVVLAAASDTVGHVVTMPSSVVATLRTVLAPEVSLEVRVIPSEWWSDSASPTLRAMIEAISEEDPT
ncbi:hypothetical protein ACNI3K_02245 [Demequina sp. SO4-13]|uniref:hypothetical protein n=1 Tax=Demequina sp. SO4-13 TaxID=3401027 RepID=UPI003AF7A61F